MLSAIVLGAACASSGAGGGGGDDATPGVHQRTLTRTDGPAVRYTIAVPDDYRGDRPAPLVVALHYGGPITPFYGGNVLELLVQPALSDLGAVIVAPDAQDKGWDDAVDEAAVLALMDHLTATMAIDRRRVVVTGYSMGAVGSWYLAGRHPDRFAAAVPVAGRPVEGLDLKVPVYAIVSRGDQVMPPAATQAEVARLAASGRQAQLLVVDDLTHFQTERFVEPLRTAVPWIQKVWSSAP